MGLGSRFLNLFSPGKDTTNLSTNSDDDDNDNSPSAMEGGEQIRISEHDPPTTATATTTTAANGATTTNQSSPPSSKIAAATTSSSSSSISRKKGHCNYPGCTRALFARGKCYRHDNEVNSGKKSSAKKKTPPADDNDDGVMSNGGKKKKSNGSSGGKKKKNSAKPNNRNEETTTSSTGKKKKREEDDRKPAAKQKPVASSSSPKGHCTQPGCTRALFARGMCYRHDTEMNSGMKSSTTTPRSSASADERKQSAKKSNGKKSSASKSKPKAKNGHATPTTAVAAKKKTPTSKSSSGSKHCNHPGCTRALFARGKCYRHDTEAQRSEKSSSSPSASNVVKTPSNSSSTALSVGRKKKRKSGDVKSTPKSASTTTASTKKAKSSSSGSKHCSHPGCTRALFARGMCYRHDTEAKRKSGGGKDSSHAARSSSSTPSSPPKSIMKKKKKVVASSSTEEQQPSSSGKKKGHCNYPGCTRALFARGKCYRHDHETKSGKKRSSSRLASSSSSAAAAAKKSNSKSAVPILPSLTKALTSSSSQQQSQRKSAIARRPRQLKPTEKLLAMQEDALALYDGAAISSSGGGKKKKRKGGKREEEGCSAPKKKKARVVVGRSCSEGGVSMEELTSNTYDDDDEESNYDNVVCCLCKCGVDFSDADFFLPEGYDEQQQQDGDEVESSFALEGEDDLDESIGMVKGNLKSEGLEEGDDSLGVESNGEVKGNLKSEEDDKDEEAKDDKSSKDDGTADDDEEKPPFQLPRRFHNPRNGLILCDGPAYAGKRRGSSSNGQQNYQCERAYHQRCHFIPVFAVPRGPWRCLICRYRDEEYLKKKGKGNAMDDSDARIFTDQELNDMFRCNIPEPQDEAEVVEEKEKAVITNVPPAMMSPSNADIASLEHEFENVTGPLKAKITKEDLTTKAEKVINAALSNIRNSEHSLRSFTETSRSRKALAERIQCIGGLPQELTQCVMRIAQNKLRIKDLIVVLEESIRCAPHHVNTKSEDATGCIDAVSELMQWYLSQSSPEEAAHCNPDVMQDGKTLLQHLFPEGDLHRRRFEPRTGEARVEAEDASVKSDFSGVSLDDLKCSCCHGGAATDDNDMLLCDGIGCYRAFHMQCLEPKVTLEEVEAGEDEAWFCPLCTAHANLVHYAQREYLLDDWEHDWDEIMRRRGHSEWETADDVFPEAELELRVAQKFKDGIKDDETTIFIAETFGIGGAAVGIESDTVDEEDLAAQDDDDEEDDEDFDVVGRVEEGSDGDSSAAEDMHEEKKLLKEKIGRDELDALSVCSSSEESDSDASSEEDEGLRRSKRRRFTFPPPAAAAAKGGDSSGNDDSKSKDMGALDTSNIVRGKRNRSKVDYRKLSDTMFGDDSDEEAKGSVMKYDYKPKKAPVDESSDEDEDESSDESDDEDDSQSQSGDK